MAIFYLLGFLFKFVLSVAGGPTVAPPIPVKTPLTNFKPPAYLDEKGQGKRLSSLHLSGV